MSYNFRGVQFSHDHSSVRGDFYGTAKVAHGMLIISGKTVYKFSDVFTDPTNIREWIGDDISDVAFNLTELAGTAYAITGSWRSDLRAKVFADKDMSAY